MTKQDGKPCRCCRRVTLHQQERRVSILAGLVLTILTGLLFLPLWWLLELGAPWRCQSCGTRWQRVTAATT